MTPLPSTCPKCGSTIFIDSGESGSGSESGCVCVSCGYNIDTQTDPIEDQLVEDEQDEYHNFDVPGEDDGA